MSKHRRTRPSATTRRRGPRQRRREPREDAEPDFLAEIAAALDADGPLPLLGIASSLLTAVDPRMRNPFGPPSEGLSRVELIESLLAAPLPETSALLTAVAALSGDDVLRRRVHREVADRAHALPAWLTDLPRESAPAETLEVSHTLGDGDDVIVAVTLPGGQVLTAVVYIDHNMGTLVKDAFVVPAPLDYVVDHIPNGTDPDTTVRPLPPADARARIGEAVERGAITIPPCESETWPSCRPLVEWMAALLPEGGTGHQRPEWDDAAVTDLGRRFRASAWAADLDDPGDLLSSVLWFGTDYGPGDPMRWSPTAVELLLLDWIPRKIIAPVDHLERAPDLLRAFIRFCHQERGIRAELTAETLAAVEVYEPEYQRLIRSDRAQGPAALLAAMGDPGYGLDEIVLDELREVVGGQAALDALDADPLPDEPFEWDALPPDVHARVGEVLTLVDGCCAELLDVEYRTVCRRLLADAAAGDPEIFRRRSRAATAAAAICWLAGQANSLFDAVPVTPKMQVKQLTAHFGLAGSSVSQRAVTLRRAIDVESDPYNGRPLGSPRYLTGRRRAHIIAQRDRHRAEAD